MDDEHTPRRFGKVAGPSSIEERTFQLPVYDVETDEVEWVDFVRRRRVPPQRLAAAQAILGRFRASRAAGETSDLAQVMADIGEFFALLLAQESAERIREFTTSDTRMVELDAMGESMAWLISEATGRPFQNRPESSDSSETDGDSFEPDASSQESTPTG